MEKTKTIFFKKKLPIIIGVVLAFIVCGGIFLLIKPKENKIEEFYNNSEQIKSEYKLAGTTLVKEAVDENNVQAVIGEEKADNFEPQILLTRWDGEVGFGVRSDISNIPTEDRILSSDGNKIILDTPKVKYEMYDLPKTNQMRDGGYEFEITLKEKPETNVVGLDINTENLVFFYQPPLNQGKQRRGETCSETQCFNQKGEEMRLRPENVVGSYAVYYEGRKAGDYSQVGGKNYKTGKAFHIFRPRVEDAKGNWAWGNLNIDERAGKLTVTIPQEFLDDATYPVRHAAGLTIGFNSEEATGWTIADTIVANRFVPEGAGNANPGTMHIWCTSNSGTANAIMGAYADNGGTVLGQPKISTTENIISKPIGDGSPSWVTDNAFVWTGIAASTDYWLAINGHDNFRIYYDSTGPGYNDNEYDGWTYDGTMPANYSDSPTTNEPATIAIYLTYDAEVEGGGSGWSTTDGQIQVNHGKIKVNHGIVKINGKYSGGWSCGDALVDSRDSESYVTVQIGTQCWMAQGLNVGTRIALSSTQDGWSGTTCTSIDKWCYNNTDATCDSTANPTYPDGGLYTWNQAMCGSTTEGVQGICPDGWHIPTDAEWYTLESYLWDTDTCSSSRIDTWECAPAGEALLPGGASGFGGNKAGYCAGGACDTRTTYGAFSISTQADVNNAWHRLLATGETRVLRNYADKILSLSVRCIKD